MDKKEHLIEVCPVCGSSDIYYEAGGYAGKLYHCKRCGYIGALVVEADSAMIEAIRSEYEKSHTREDLVED
ncbi:hypothetical protein [Methanothrix sp.]|uniref:hypothetical protein n=1 Tax=Methanothrix sp. TaxID=90426 RepID=UPI00343BA74A